jgi:hypothetical protein
LADIARVLAQFRKALGERRHTSVERLTKRLEEREYLTLCGRVQELDELAALLRDLIRKEHSNEGEDDGDSTEDRH